MRLSFWDVEYICIDGKKYEWVQTPLMLHATDPLLVSTTIKPSLRETETYIEFSTRIQTTFKSRICVHTGLLGCNRILETVKASLSYSRNITMKGDFKRFPASRRKESIHPDADIRKWPAGPKGFSGAGGTSSPHRASTTVHVNTKTLSEQHTVGSRHFRIIL